VSPGFGDEHVQAKIVRTIAFLTDAHKNRAVPLATLQSFGAKRSPGGRAG
jgi:hypothetical protein